MQVLYRHFTLSLWLLSYPVDSTRITIFIYQGQVKAAQMKGTIASLNDFTEYIRCATAKKRRKEKMDWMTAGKFLQEEWKLVFTFVFTSCCRYPHHDVHVWWSACVRVHPVSATDRPVSLPWTLLRCSLHLRGLPPPALREASGAEDEQRFAGWSLQEGESHFARLQSCQVPQTK